MPEREGQGEIQKDSLETPKEPQKIELHITLFPETNALSVSGGAMQCIITSVGMCELAKDTIRQYHANKHSKSAIVQPKGGLMQYVRGRRR